MACAWSGAPPNLPETVIAMLATMAPGAIWSSTSPDFGIKRVVERFGQIAPKVLNAVDAYPFGDKTHDCLKKLRGVLDAIPEIEHSVAVPYSGRALNLANPQSLEAFAALRPALEDSRRTSD